MANRTPSEREAVGTVAARYEADGYQVRVWPRQGDLPTELHQFRPDIIATSPTRRVVVEVRRSDRSTDEGLSELTHAAAALGWEVDVVFLPPPPPPVWSSDDRRARLEEAGLLLNQGHLEAATLLAWAVFEALVRERLAEIAGEDSANTPRPASIVDEALSVGLLVPAQREWLTGLVRARNAVAHGRTDPTGGMDAVPKVLELVAWLSSPDFTSVDEMIEWFHSEYEDPAEWVPYDSAEGGYQYPGGEPHDALEVLSSRYSEAPEEVVAEAASLIESDGFQWVRKDRS